MANKGLLSSLKQDTDKVRCNKVNKLKQVDQARTAFLTAYPNSRVATHESRYELTSASKIKRDDGPAVTHVKYKNWDLEVRPEEQ